LLRIASEDAADADLDVRAERDVALERRASGDDAAVADRAVRTDDCERADRHVGPDSGVLVDDRRRVNPGHQLFHRHRSRTIAPISASQTMSPSTLATPDTFAITPRTWSTSSSKRS